MTETALDRLQNEPQLAAKYQGKIALLCHSASVNKNYEHAIDIFKNLFGDRFIKIFGPQHGIVTDVQDNMVETDHYTHPHYKLPVYSLYSETRIPTDEMLEGIDHFFIDLQDVGTRIYTYIYTMTYVLEACAKKGIQVIILDRPNPLGGETVEGNVLKTEFASFVGRHELPYRHGLTIGEVALMHQKYWANDHCEFEVLTMNNYKRDMYFEDTKLPWVWPSPNLPTIESCFGFVSTVVFEATNISEGRGTTHSLEVVGHPDINPWELRENCNKVFENLNISGVHLRELTFQPTFQKHAKVNCGGVQIHITDRKNYQGWRVGLIICKEIKKLLGDKFSFKLDPYEYESEMNPFDMINGDDRMRKWLEQSDDNYDFLDLIEAEKLSDFISKKESVHLY